MPYKRVGKKVYHKKGGRWKVKQTCRNPTNAKRAISLLRALEHNPNWKPTGKKSGWYNHRKKHRVAAYKRKARKSFASIGSYYTSIEDVYYTLDKAGLHHTQLGDKLVTDNDVFKGKNDAYWKIRVPIKCREKPLIFQTYSGRKDIAHKYVKVIRMVQKRSQPGVRGGYLQGLYSKPRPVWA